MGDKGSLQVFKDMICGNCQLCSGCDTKDSKITVQWSNDKNRVQTETLACGEYKKPEPIVA